MAGDHTYISNINIVIVDLDYFFFFCLLLLLLLKYNLVSIYQRHLEVFHVKVRCRSAAGRRSRSIASDHVGLQSSRRASCLQTGQECVSVVFGRPGSRPVHSDLESELGAVGVSAPNSMVLSGRGLYCRFLCMLL